MTGTTTIPTFDVATGNGNELVAALQATSCVLLTGLGGIPAEAAAAVAQADIFFSLEASQKALVQWSGTGEWSGWQPLYEATGGNALALERFEIALPDPQPYASTIEWAAKFDQWPEQPAAMSAVWATYYRSLRELSFQLVGLLAEALGLPDADVAAWTSGQHSNLCANHYLAQIEPPPPGQVRQKPHTDHGGLTLLWTDGQPGLEAQIGADGTWVPLEVPSDVFLLQAGDLLHLWTGGRIPANSHRVANPDRGADVAQQDRYSLVYFHHPDLDSSVSPTEGAETGVTARDHVRKRQQASYVAS